MSDRTIPDRITIRVSNPLEMAELDRRAAAVSLQIGPYMREVALGRIPAGPPSEELARLTRVLRERVERSDDAVADMHDLLDQIETALGLVAADGSRIDDAPAVTSRGQTCVEKCAKYPRCSHATAEDATHNKQQAVRQR